MKTCYTLSFLLIFTLAFSSCKKEFPGDLLSIKNLNVSDCKSVGMNKKGDVIEYITLKTVDDYYIHFKHVNSLFNCEPGEITVTFDISETTITIDENESSSLANCICPYDLDFKIGPLLYGNYTLIFQKGGISFKEYSLDFKRSTDTKIVIKEI